jgi:DNA-binding MarR family transcriptional regulator
MRISEDARPTTWRLLMRAHWYVVEAVREALKAEHGLPLEWYDVLVHLGEARGRRLRMSQLADSLALSRSWLTRRVDAMERAGLVERERAASDGRGRYSVLTTSGLDTLRRAERTRRRVVDGRFYRPLRKEELGTMRGALLTVCRAAEEP